MSTFHIRGDWLTHVTITHSSHKSLICNTNCIQLTLPSIFFYLNEITFQNKLKRMDAIQTAEASTFKLLKLIAALLHLSSTENTAVKWTRLHQIWREPWENHVKSADSPRGVVLHPQMAENSTTVSEVRGDQAYFFIFSYAPVFFSVCIVCHCAVMYTKYN